MRRPWLVTITAALEALLSLALIATAVILVRKSGDASGPVAAGILGGIGLLAVVSCWGLWKSRAWGWWLALLIDSLGLTAFLWDPVTRRVKPDPDELAFIIMFALLVFLVLLSPVRRFLLRQDEKRAETGS